MQKENPPHPQTLLIRRQGQEPLLDVREVLWWQSLRPKEEVLPSRAKDQLFEHLGVPIKRPRKGEITHQLKISIVNGRLVLEVLVLGCDRRWSQDQVQGTYLFY